MGWDAAGPLGFREGDASNSVDRGGRGGRPGRGVAGAELANGEGLGAAPPQRRGLAGGALGAPSVPALRHPHGAPAPARPPRRSSSRSPAAASGEAWQVPSGAQLCPVGWVRGSGEDGDGFAWLSWLGEGPGAGLGFDPEGSCALTT